MKQRSEAWYRARAGRITGSRFARAMASKHSDTYRDLVDELTQERRTGRALDGGYINAAMQWGMDHEDTARRWYSRNHGCQVDQIGFVVHPEYDFVGVSPDGLVAHDGLIEIKCPQAKGFRQVMDSRQMPTRYRWQVQGQLWVCERRWLDFVCFYPPGRGIAIRIHRSTEDFDALADRCVEINREVERRIGQRRPVAVAAQQPARVTAAPRRDALPEAWAATTPPIREPRGGLPTWVWFVLIVVGLGILRHIFR